VPSSDIQRMFCTFSELLLASGLGYERDEICCRAFIAHKLILILRYDAGTFCPVTHADCKYTRRTVLVEIKLEHMQV
jgi:hypothetical protein